MDKPTLLQQTALLRDEASRARRLAVGLQGADKARLNRFGEQLREEATELARQAAAQTTPRPAEPGGDATQDGQKPKKGRGGSSDPEPQA